MSCRPRPRKPESPGGGRQAPSSSMVTVSSPHPRWGQVESYRADLVEIGVLHDVGDGFVDGQDQVFGDVGVERAVRAPGARQLPQCGCRVRRCCSRRPQAANRRRLSGGRGRHAATAGFGGSGLGVFGSPEGVGPGGMMKKWGWGRGASRQSSCSEVSTRGCDKRSPRPASVVARVCCRVEGADVGRGQAAAMAQRPWSRCRPRTRRRRRLSAATRVWSQALFLVTPRWGTRRLPRVSQAMERSTMGRWRR